MRVLQGGMAAWMMVSLFLLGGCVSVPPGSDIVRQQARSMVPPEGWGAVYVFRPALPPGERFWGVNLDSKHFGYLSPKSYLYGVVQPGEHQLDLEYSGSIIKFSVSKGENRYFKITFGFPGMVLSAISADEAEKLVGAYTPSAFNVFENDQDRKLFLEPKPSN